MTFFVKVRSFESRTTIQFENIFICTVCSHPFTINPPPDLGSH